MKNKTLYFVIKFYAIVFAMVIAFFVIGKLISIFI